MSKCPRKSVALAFSFLFAFAVIVGCGDSHDNGVRLTVADPPAEIIATQPPTSTTLPSPTSSHVPPTETAAEAFPPLGTRTDWELVNTQGWLNGEPTTISDLRDEGEVVLVDFWTYT